jgi:hypothetical protein
VAHLRPRCLAPAQAARAAAVTHEEFVAAYREGKLAVQVDPKAAAKLVSARMMLPLILLPVLGLAVALALTGYLVSGVLLFIAGLVFRYFVRRSSRGFVLTHSIENPAFYQQVVTAGILTATKT